MWGFGRPPYDPRFCGMSTSDYKSNCSATRCLRVALLICWHLSREPGRHRAKRTGLAGAVHRYGTQASLQLLTVLLSTMNSYTKPENANNSWDLHKPSSTTLAQRSHRLAPVPHRQAQRVFLGGATCNSSVTGISRMFSVKVFLRIPLMTWVQDGTKSQAGAQLNPLPGSYQV